MFAYVSGGKLKRLVRSHQIHRVQKLPPKYAVYSIGS